MDKQPLISLDALSLTIGERALMHEMSFQLFKGEKIGITGPSGCGKTTLLREIVKGKLSKSFKAKRFEVADARFAYVPQQNGLVPWWSIRRNLLFAARRSVNSQSANEQIANIAESYGFKQVFDNFPDQISGGEYQRAVLACAVVSNPEILVVDEPLNGVDIYTKWEILEQFAADIVQKEIGLLMVSHDIEVLCFLCDHVLVLRGQPAQQFVVEKIQGEPLKDMMEKMRLTSKIYG